MLKKLKAASKIALSKAKNVRGKLPSGKYIVALDIGTENVKALVGSIKDEHIEIIGVGRAHQNLADMQAGAIADISAVTTNCDKALADAETQAGVNVTSVVIGIAGELVKGTTTTVRITRKDAQKPLAVDEVEQMVTLVQQRAEKQAKEQLAVELGGKNVDVRLVNSALVRMVVDGYPVTNPVGFQGREVLVQLYTAFAPMIHIGALERVADELDLELIAVAAEPFAVSRAVIGDDPNASLSAILMDVGGGTTDIAVVHEGGVQGTKMFGIGGRAFTKGIERELGVDFIQAEALKVGLSKQRIPHQKVPTIERALQKTLDVWQSGVELALGEFELENLPNRMLLCGGGASLHMLVEDLQGDDWYKHLPFTKRPQVQHISPDDVVGVIDKTDELHDHTFITAMGLLRVGADTISQTGQNPTLSNFKDKFNRLMKV